MRLTLTRSDAMSAEHGPAEDVTLETKKNVEITYDTLRDSETNLPIAYIADGGWYTAVEPAAGPFSDIIIEPHWSN